MKQSFSCSNSDVEAAAKEEVIDFEGLWKAWLEPNCDDASSTLDGGAVKNFLAVWLPGTARRAVVFERIVVGVPCSKRAAFRTGVPSCDRRGLRRISVCGDDATDVPKRRFGGAIYYRRRRNRKYTFCKNDSVRALFGVLLGVLGVKRYY